MIDDDTPEGYHVRVDLTSPTDDRLRIAWWYGEEGEQTPVRILVEDSEGGNAAAYLTPSEGVLVAKALLEAARQGREAMAAGVPVLPDVPATPVGSSG